MTAARVLPEPHRGALVRTRTTDGKGGCIWHGLEAGLWFMTPTAPGTLPVVKNWGEVTSGNYGTVVELLVPVPYTAPEDGTPGGIAVDRLVHHVLGPVADMMQQLAAATGAGLSAVVAESDRRGYLRGYTDADNGADPEAPKL